MNILNKKIKDYITNKTNNLEVTCKDIQSESPQLKKILIDAYIKHNISLYSIQLKDCIKINSYNYLNMPPLVIFKYGALKQYMITDNEFNVLYKNLPSLKDVVSLYPLHMEYSNIDNIIQLKKYEVKITRLEEVTKINFIDINQARKFVLGQEIYRDIEYLTILNSEFNNLCIPNKDLVPMMKNIDASEIVTIIKYSEDYDKTLINAYYIK